MAFLLKVGRFLWHLSGTLVALAWGELVAIASTCFTLASALVALVLLVFPNSSPARQQELPDRKAKAPQEIG